jgi:hypothetical protein
MGQVGDMAELDWSKVNPLVWPAVKDFLPLCGNDQPVAVLLPPDGRVHLAEGEMTQDALFWLVAAREVMERVDKHGIDETGYAAAFAPEKVEQGELFDERPALPDDGRPGRRHAKRGGRGAR